MFHLCTPTDPLDTPVLMNVICFNYNQLNITFITVTWEQVDCAELYALSISGIDSITTNETSYATSYLYDVSTSSISGNLYAFGGSVRSFSEECLDYNPTTPGWFSAIDCIHVHVCTGTCTHVHTHPNSLFSSSKFLC